MVPTMADSLQSRTSLETSIEFNTSSTLGLTMTSVKPSLEWNQLKQWFRCGFCFILGLLVFMIVFALRQFIFFYPDTPLNSSSMALTFRFRENDTGGTCSGTFITIEKRYFVQTAAHCLSGATDLYVYGGVANLALISREKLIETRKFITDKHFHPITLKHDMGLIELDSSVKHNNDVAFIPSSIPKPPVYAGQKCEVWGWPSPDSKNGLSENLRKVPVTITNGNGSLCKDPGLIFAESNNNLVIEGFSGGPLVCSSTQVGIVVGFNFDCGQTFYIDIRTYDYKELLRQMDESS